MASSTYIDSRSVELDIRVEDYLDDKIQSSTDLENLDTLLASVEYQRSQLQSQLDDATKELQEARQSAEDRQAELTTRIQEFNQLQKSIDTRLQVVASSDAPDEAIHRLEKPMKQLHKVDLAHKYLLLLQDVKHLQEEARAFLPQDPKAALDPYTKLKQLAILLKQLQGPADEAAVHLVAYVASVTDTLWDEMKKTMWNELDTVLAKRSWPKIDPASAVDEEWRRCFEKLIDLQAPEVLYSPTLIPILPIEVMSQIFIREFRFHFMSDKATSAPQAIGTHCLPWFIALVEKWEDFFRDNFGAVLAAKFQSTTASAKMAYIDPACAFITSMLPVLREKIFSALGEAAQNPIFLSSLMSQLITFDENIRSTFNYDGGNPEQGWGGLTSEVLEVHFDTWLRAEKDFALERFQVIMDTPDARTIDYEYAAVGRTKPTFGAVRVTDLLRSVTNQYNRLQRFSYKLRFLLDIQITILDEYHDRLRGSLEVYNNITSTVGRTLHGATKEQLAALEGTGAFETLCKVFGSAEHIVLMLRDWSNEEFFVTLWDQLQTKAKKADDRANIAGDMSYDDVKGRTSSAVGTDADGGVLFDETIAAYRHCRTRAQGFLVDAVAESHHKAFKAYLQRPQWTPVSDDPSPIDLYRLAITAELDEPLRIMNRNLEFLAKALSTAAFRRVWREVLAKLNNMLWNDVLMGQKFTTLGAAQFMRDLHAVCALVDRYVPEGSIGLGSVTDGTKLLNLPVEAEDGGVSLKKGSDMVFTDNTEAKKLLETLEIDSLTPANARQILQKRIETNND